MRILTGGRYQAALAFSPDGRYIASVVEPNRSGQSVLQGDQFVPVIYEPDFGGRWGVQVWDLSEAGTFCLAVPWDEAIGHLTYDPDGQHLLIPRQGTVTRVRVGNWEVHERPLPSGCEPQEFSADCLATVGARRSREGWFLHLWLTRWEVGGWAEGWRAVIDYDAIAEPDGYTDLVLDSAGTRLVRVHRRRHATTAGNEYGLQSFDGRTGRYFGEWIGVLPERCEWRLVGPRGVFIHFRGWAFYAVDLDRPQSAPVKRLNTSLKHFTSAAFSPDGRWLATTSNDALVTLWDTTSWEPARQLAWDIGRLRSVAFSPDGTLCAAGSDAGQVVVWDFDG